MIDPFHDVRDKRMGELSPEQQERAAELWLRTNCSPRGSVGAYWWQHLQTLFRIIDRLRHEVDGQRARSTDRRTPIDMILNCPACGLQHIDAPDERTPDWKNEPHRSHLCHGCGHIWRPADVPTNGVAAIKTKGKADSPIDPRPVAIESLAQRVPLSEEQIYQVIEAARESYRAHTTGIRGQMLTIYDDMDWHLVRAVEQAHGIRQED